MLLAHGLVVAVEQHPEGRVKRLKTGLEALQHKGLEEPGHVRQVPLGGAGVGHGLHLAVSFGKRRGQRLGLGAHLHITLRHLLAGRVGGRWVGRLWRHAVRLLNLLGARLQRVSSLREVWLAASTMATISSMAPIRVAVLPIWNSPM